MLLLKHHIILIFVPLIPSVFLLKSVYLLPFPLFKCGAKNLYTIVGIVDLLLKYEKSAIAVLPQVAQCLEIVQDPKGLAAIIWILGEYGQVTI